MLFGIAKPLGAILMCWIRYELLPLRGQPLLDEVLSSRKIAISELPLLARLQNSNNAKKLEAYPYSLPEIHMPNCTWWRFLAPARCPNSRVNPSVVVLLPPLAVPCLGRCFPLSLFVAVNIHLLIRYHPHTFPYPLLHILHPRLHRHVRYPHVRQPVRAEPALPHRYRLL